MIWIEHETKYQFFETEKRSRYPDTQHRSPFATLFYRRRETKTKKEMIALHIETSNKVMWH